MPMYNRYIPQPDGSFRRNAVPEPKSSNQAPQSRPAPSDRPPKKSPSEPRNSIGFLRQLLPADFDSSDCIILLLLILMSGDKPEDRSHMLMTLALYLLM